MSRRITLGLNAVIVAVTDDDPRVLAIETPDGAALPSGPLDPDRHRTLELGLRGWVREQAGLDLGYVEQLYTFGDRDRIGATDERLVSVVYLALVEERDVLLPSAGWRSIYDFLPWEDWREGRPAALDERLIPGLQRWLERVGRTAERRERCAVAFGLRGAPWDGERALERIELLYEAGVIVEGGGAEPAAIGGTPMVLDHRRMLANALGRLRGKIRYRPVIFELLPRDFTLFRLQRTAEALAGTRLHKQNFRRLVQRGGLVEGTGELDTGTGGRPAELFRFRQDVVRERPAPGVGLPPSSA